MVTCPPDVGISGISRIRAEAKRATKARVLNFRENQLRKVCKAERQANQSLRNIWDREASRKGL